METQKEEILVQGFKLCYKRCMTNPDQIKSSHIHHAVYPCLEHCASKYQKVIKLAFE